MVDEWGDEDRCHPIQNVFRRQTAFVEDHLVAGLQGLDPIRSLQQLADPSHAAGSRSDLSQPACSGVELQDAAGEVADEAADPFQSEIGDCSKWPAENCLDLDLVQGFTPPGYSLKEELAGPLISARTEQVVESEISSWFYLWLDKAGAGCRNLDGWIGHIGSSRDQDV